MAYLVLVRHGQSKWNALGKWTGWTDVDLSEQGRSEARRAAKVLKRIIFHKAYTSKLKRAKQTLDEIKEALKIAHLQTEEHEALNERRYGRLTGKNKWEIKEKHGEEQFKKWRRSWDHPVPGGETLKDVHARVVPYYKKRILQDLKEGKNVLISAHGNSLRGLVKHLENIADDKIASLEIGTGDVYLYKINKDGEIEEKEILVTNKWEEKKGLAFEKFER